MGRRVRAPQMLGSCHVGNPTHPCLYFFFPRTGRGLRPIGVIVSILLSNFGLLSFPAMDKDRYCGLPLSLPTILIYIRLVPLPPTSFSLYMGANNIVAYCVTTQFSRLSCVASNKSYKSTSNRSYFLQTVSKYSFDEIPIVC